MPRSFYEPEEQDTSACGKLRDDLKYCLQQTDCFKKEGKSMKECLVSHHPSVPEECFQLRTSFFSCKRSLLDARQRFRGKKEY